MHGLSPRELSSFFSLPEARDLPLGVVLAGFVRRRSLCAARLSWRWKRPRRRTFSSLSEDGMERLCSSSRDRSLSESESWSVGTRCVGETFGMKVGEVPADSTGRAEPPQADHAHESALPFAAPPSAAACASSLGPTARHL